MTDEQKIKKLLDALKLVRLHLDGTLLEHAIISLDHPEVPLGGYLDAVIAEVEK